jgi:hypothetical protein
MEEKRKQIMQKVKNPNTGEMMNLKTYSGKEFFWEAEQYSEEEKIGQDEEYAKLWEDDRL